MSEDKKKTEDREIEPRHMRDMLETFDDMWEDFRSGMLFGQENS